MLIVKENNYSSESPLAQILQTITKAEIKKIAETVNFPVSASLNKYDYICQYATMVESCAELWMCTLPKFEIELLKRIVELPKGEGVTTYLPHYGLMLSDMCIIVARNEDEEGCVTLYLTTEQLRKCMKDAIAKSEKYMKEGAWNKLYDNGWEEMAMGLLNYFGLMPLNEFVSQMKRRTKVASGSDEENYLHWIMFDKVLFAAAKVIVHEDRITNTYLRSTMLNDIDSLFREWNRRPDLKQDYDKPTNEQLMAYGKQPFMTPYSKEEKAMYDCLVKEQKLSKEKADWAFSELWRKEQTTKNPSETMGWINSIGTFTSMEQISRMMNIFLNFCNHIPKWELCGNTSDYLFSKQEKPRLQPLPMVKTPNIPTSGKIGRNDPCPCGSGKKYKNCCGR